MPKFCPECGKPNDETSKFCINCGANLSTASPVAQQEPVQSIQEKKSPFLAVLCSFFIPGLGQVYDGESGRGVAILLGTVLGLFIFIIPGLIVWMFGMYDAYSMAKRMNNGEIPFQHTRTVHFILFFVLAFFILVIVIFFVLMGLVNALATAVAHAFMYSTPGY